MQNTNGRGEDFVRFVDYPQAMTADDRSLWVLLWPGGSSAQARAALFDRLNAVLVALDQAPRRGARHGRLLRSLNLRR